MRPVIDRAFAELWEPLAAAGQTPRGFFGELFAGVAPYLKQPELSFIREEDGDVRSVEETIELRLARALGNDEKAQELLFRLSFDSFVSESDATLAVSSTASVLEDLELSGLRVLYVKLLRVFVDRYSLRYYVDDSGGLWPTFFGVAAELFDEIRLVANGDHHVRAMLAEFERGVADCLLDPHEGNIKTAISKQVMLLEAIGHSCNAADLGDTLGAMCSNVDAWPHEELQRAARSLNKFVNNYPGIRHGGTPANATRVLDGRDLVAVMLGLLSITPYFTDQMRREAGVVVDSARPQATLGTGSIPPWSAAGS